MTEGKRDCLFAWLMGRCLGQEVVVTLLEPTAFVLSLSGVSSVATFAVAMAGPSGREWLSLMFV